MKLYLPLILALSSPVTSATADINALMSSITTAAFAEVSEQMAVQVNLSGKQRMLTQKMTKEALLISLGINTDDNKKNLQDSIQLFDKTLLGLQSGDESLQLIKTSNTEILEQLEKVSELWKSFNSQLKTFEEDPKNATSLSDIASNNIPLLVAMNEAVSLYAKNSGSDLNDLATVINLSGKQRMLTQKMTKEFLLISKGINTDKNKEGLKESIQLFEKTLSGLLNGDETLGLPKTTNKEITAQLAIIEAAWQELAKIIKKNNSKKETLQELETLNLTVLTEMDKAVKMYEQQSKNKS